MRLTRAGLVAPALPAVAPPVRSAVAAVDALGACFEATSSATGTSARSRAGMSQPLKAGEGRLTFLRQRGDGLPAAKPAP